MARILISGFCAVPGPTRSGVQLRQVVRALGGRHTVDLLAVREGDQAYVERLGSGRLLRVPTHDADLATQVQAFQRALRRQLEGADYDVVHCRDGWSARPVRKSPPAARVFPKYRRAWPRYWNGLPRNTHYCEQATLSVRKRRQHLRSVF